VKSAQPQIKDWICLLKYWKCRFNWPTGYKIRSYFLELLGIHIVNIYNPTSTKEFLQRFFEIMENLQNLYVDFGNKQRIPTMFHNIKPFVCDPANPTNNVADFLDTELMKLVRKAISFGMAPFTNDIKDLLYLKAHPKWCSECSKIYPSNRKFKKHSKQSHGTFFCQYPDCERHVRQKMVLKVIKKQRTTI